MELEIEDKLSTKLIQWKNRRKNFLWCLLVVSEYASASNIGVCWQKGPKFPNLHKN